MKKFIIRILNKYTTKNVTIEKLDKGYVCGNKYYTNIDELFELLKKEIKKL